MQTQDETFRQRQRTAKPFLNWIRSSLLYRKLRWFGTRYWCPSCESRLNRFISTRSDPDQIYDALCPICQSKHPHRRGVLLLRQLADQNCNRGRILHIAPEPIVARTLRRRYRGDYVAGDLRPGPGQVQLDIADLPFPDRHFGLIFCCHVLNMIPALSVPTAVAECYRVLEPGGVAIIENPVAEGTTCEMEQATEDDRRDRWGSHDVMRLFGRDDYWPMFERAGFTIVEQTIASPTQAERWRLYRTSIHYLIRPAE